MKMALMAKVSMGSAMLAGVLALNAYASASAPNMGYVPWNVYMLGVDNSETAEDIKKAVAGRSVTVAVASWQDGHDDDEMWECTKTAEELGLTVNVVKIGPQAAGRSLKQVYEEAAEHGDIVVDYRSYWDASVVASACESIAAHPDKLFILPYGEINGKDCPPTSTSLQGQALHANGTGFPNLITAIPLARVANGALMRPSRRTSEDTATATVVAPNSWAASAGTTCPAAAVATAVASYVFAARGDRPSAREIVRIMRAGSGLPAPSAEAQFDETALAKLKSELETLTTEDQFGRKMLLTGAVLNVKGVFDVIAAESGCAETKVLTAPGTYDVVASVEEAEVRGIADAVVVKSAAQIVVAASDVTVKLYPSLRMPRLRVNAGCVNVKAYLSAEVDVVAEGFVAVERFAPEWSPDTDGWEKLGCSPLLWLDPSIEESFTYVKISTGQTATDGNKHNLLYAWHDRRTPTDESGRFLKNNRYANGAADINRTVFPIVMTNAQNGLPLVDFGPSSSGRRAYLFNGASTRTGTSQVAPGTVVFVYSGCGDETAISGSALFGGKDAQSVFYGRNAQGTLITTNRFMAWQDGQKVFTDRSNLKLGAQVISLAAKGKAIDGLGYSNRFYNNLAHPQGADCGGMAYGEILFFEAELSAFQRDSVERYLAKKWGTETATTITVRAYGAGAIRVTGGIRIGGAFEGSLQLTDGEVEIDGRGLPPDETALPMEHCLAWIDPEKDGALTTSKYGSDLAIQSVYNRVGWDADGALRLWYGGSGYDARRAYLTREVCGFGGKRNWMVFKKGSSMRFSKLPSTGSATETIQAKTIVLAQNSVRGGGTPLLTAAAGSSGDLRLRLNKDDTPDPSVPIWNNTTTANCFADGQTRLNGFPVDGSSEGFLGRPEVLSAVVGPSKANGVGVGLLGYYNHNTETAGENIGEVLVFDTELSENVLEKVEAYLMWKWFGETRAGYSALMNATVCGDGMVKADSHATMPKLAAEFSGRVNLTASTLHFVFSDKSQTADNAILAGANVLALPQAVTVDVCFNDKPTDGAHVLLTGELAGSVEWTLGTVTGIRNDTEKRLRYDAAEKALYLDIKNPGALIMLR